MTPRNRRKGMKHPWRILLLIALVLMPAASPLAQETNNSFVVVITDMPPFRITEQWDGAGKFSGVFVDAISEMSERTGIKLSFTGKSYAEALAMIGDGSADMMLGVKWTAQQTVFMEYLSSWFPAESHVFFRNPGQKDLWTYDDLSGVRIGILRASRHFDRLDTDKALLKVEFDSYTDAFRALYDRQVDVVLAPLRQGRYTLKQLGMAFELATYHDPGEPTYIAISKKSLLLRERKLIDDVLIEMRRERYFERLLEIYDF